MPSGTCMSTGAHELCLHVRPPQRAPACLRASQGKDSRPTESFTRSISRVTRRSPCPNSMRVGINGFGRIGRVAARVLLERGWNVVHVNDPSCDPSLVAHALRSDSVYGGVTGSVSVSGEGEVAVSSAGVDWRVRV